MLRLSINILFLTACSFMLSLGGTKVHAQSQVEMANLFQDVALLKTEVGQLSLEVQHLSSQNKQLNADMVKMMQRQAQLSESYFTALSETEKRIEMLRKELVQANNLQKKEIIKNVSSQLELFAKETDKAFKNISRQSVASKPAPEKPRANKTFSSDFPQNGVEYTVKKGDSLWRIASSLNSKVSWIEDANKIVSPEKDLKIGQVIFVPQK